MNRLQKFCLAVVSLGATAPAFALPTTEIQTAITAAETDGLAVGAMVVSAVAAMIVVGVVISMVKKL
jgi:hypothetical protein